MIWKILYTIFLFLGVLGILFLTEFLHQKKQWPVEFTRKLAHSLASISSLLLLVVIDSHYYVLALEAASFAVLLWARKTNRLHSVEKVKRDSLGSLLLPIAIYCMYLSAEVLQNDIYFVLPLLILGISDPLAALSGMKYQERTNQQGKNKKTIAGGITFFLSALLISFAVMLYFDYSFTPAILLASGLALISGLTEFFSRKGIDNLSIPLISIAFLWLIH
jgi:phytol kinase